MFCVTTKINLVSGTLLLLLCVHTEGRSPDSGLEGLSQMQNLEIEEILRDYQDDQRHGTTSVQGISKQAIILILEKEATDAVYDKYI